jgi:hypothetical protein
MYWLYELRTFDVFALTVGVVTGTMWLGLLFLRPFFRIWLARQMGANDIVGAFLSYFGVIYGLLLGLLAVAVYQNKTDVDRVVSREAASLASLFRDVSAYPEPLRSRLRSHLRDYTRTVIEKDWPKQRRGQVPRDSTEVLDGFQQRLVEFQPKTSAEEILHAEAYSQFNVLIENRRARLHSVDTGIPAAMWYTLTIGALLNTVLIWSFDAHLRTLFFLGGLISFFNGTMIALIIVLDNPYRGGELATSALVFQETLQGLMR